MWGFLAGVVIAQAEWERRKKDWADQRRVTDKYQARVPGQVIYRDDGPSLSTMIMAQAIVSGHDHSKPAPDPDPKPIVGQGGTFDGGGASGDWSPSPSSGASSYESSSCSSSDSSSSYSSSDSGSSSSSGSD